MQKTSQAITPSEQQIYNKFHAVTRTCMDKPFKLRKDFTDFPEKFPEKIFYLKKLSLFFKRFQHISPDEFFKAPFDIYPDDNNFDLKFYTSQRALKVYTMYIQKREMKSPDSDDQLVNIKKSLEYILKFCNLNKIKIHEYTHHVTGNIPTFVQHMKECNVSVYVMFGFPDFEPILMAADKDHVKFMIGDILMSLPKYRTLFASSSLAKKFVKSGIGRIKELQSEDHMV